jgi:GTP-binding protein
VINLYELPSGTTFVDLPGYGYAAVPGRMRGSWQQMIEGYLLGRDELEQIFVLVDGEIGPTKLDVQMLEWLRHESLPHSVVATKMDKVKSSVRDRRKRDLAAACMLERGDIAWVSAAKGDGISELRGRITTLLS